MAVGSRTVLLVASSGGHVAELYRLAPRVLEPGDEPLWVTNDTQQTRSLLHEEQVVWMPYLGSRNLSGTAAAVVPAVRLVRRARPRLVVSTGSGIALAFLPPSRALGVPCHYVESATRTRGPSLTGTALARVPGVHCYTQHPAWAGRRWHYGGSVLEGYQPTLATPVTAVRRVVITLGTWRQPFRRLVDRLLTLLPLVVAPDADILWQTGHTDVPDVPDARPFVPARELADAIREADLVVTHAGMGATMDALEAGRCPVVVPRTASAGEQVDDHQRDLAHSLSAAGLVVAVDADALGAQDLLRAAGRATRATPPGRFELR